MRMARIKIPANEGEAVYHCMSRTVNGERLFDDVAKEVLRRQLWQVAQYCGVVVLTYAVLSNHFHVVVRIPRLEQVSDEELMRRYRALYPKPTKHRSERLEVIAADLGGNGPTAAAWRRRHLAMMGDVSRFMQLLKQRFSIWFNATHGRFGTLWAERFKSVLLEGRDRLVQTVAAYVDLNCVRAGLTADPKEYRFCGYAEAVAGSEAARDGLCAVMGCADWSDAQAQYRQVLFGTAAGERAEAATISPADCQKVIDEGGRLSLATLLRCRVRYFTDGAVLGSRAFVQVYAGNRLTNTCSRGVPPVQSLPTWADCGDLVTLRGVRSYRIG